MGSLVFSSSIVTTCRIAYLYGHPSQIFGFYPSIVNPWPTASLFRFPCIIWPPIPLNELSGTQLLYMDSLASTLSIWTNLNLISERENLTTDKNRRLALRIVSIGNTTCTLRIIQILYRSSSSSLWPP